MNKIHLTSFLILGIATFACSEAFAQSITPQVIATTGGHGASANAQLSWTVGEVAVTTLSGGTSMITQGFHQTYDIATMVEESPAGMELRVYPNPTSDVVQVNLSGSHDQLSLTLHDISGRLVYSMQISADAQAVVVPMEACVAGTYVLRIFSNDATMNHAYRIVKN
jgi:hypothetical protein